MPQANLGRSVSWAGDVDGDGHVDFIVGESPNDVGSPDPGRAHVFSGRDCSAICTVVGEAPGIRFGVAVSGVGDADGDGFDDFIVGADVYQPSGVFGRGRAYLYSGRTCALECTFTGEDASGQFGNSVAAAGDVDGDGYPDVIVGAPIFGTPKPGAGAAYVFSGRTCSRLHRFTGVKQDDNCGASVSGAGDLDQDGYYDVIVGCPLDDSGFTNAGCARVYSGSNGSQLAQFCGSRAEDRLGSSVSNAGDVDGDGWDDPMAGAIEARPGEAGYACVYSGRTGAALCCPDGEAAGDNFGRDVAGAGDVNADGFADVIVGAYLNDAGGVDAGRAYVFGGPTCGSLCTLTGEAPGDFFGWGVSSAGDVDRDGVGEIIVGAPLNDAGGPNKGRAYVHGFELPCDDPDPASQGYWHRQCLGVPPSDGGLDPGRNGRGPSAPTEPGFVDSLMPCAEAKLEDLGFYAVTTCEGMDATPPSDSCERAEKQLTALVLNVCSDRLRPSCSIDTSAQGCSATSVGDLMTEVAELIHAGDCEQAADCADAVNEGTGLVASGGGTNVPDHQRDELQPPRTNPPRPRYPRLLRHGLVDSKKSDAWPRR